MKVQSKSNPKPKTSGRMVLIRAAFEVTVPLETVTSMSADDYDASIPSIGIDCTTHELVSYFENETAAGWSSFASLLYEWNLLTTEDPDKWQFDVEIIEPTNG